MKSIKYLVFIIIFSSFFCHSFAKERYVLGGRWAGLFSNVLGVINHLIWCEKQDVDLVVHWYDKPKYYLEPLGYNGTKNVWEYYFYPVSRSLYHDEDVVHEDYFAPDGSGIDCNYKKYPECFSYEYRSFINQYIQKYIHIKETILKKIDNFYQKNMKGKKVIGIHIRRTDHHESPRISLEKYAKKAVLFNDAYYFIATDDKRVLDGFKKTFPGKVLYYDSYRSLSHKALHIKNPEVENRALMGEQVLIEAKLLSLCDCLIHSVSNVSLAALFFNPHLQNIYLSDENN